MSLNNLITKKQLNAVNKLKENKCDQKKDNNR